MDVVPRRQQGVEAARRERPPPFELESTGPRPVELLVLISRVEADKPPGQMVVHRGHSPRRDDEAEQRERPISSPEEQPLADPATHPTLDRRLPVTLRKPEPVCEQPDEEWLDQPARLLRRGRTIDQPPHSVDELTHNRRIEDVFVLCERRQSVVEVAHRIGPTPTLTHHDLKGLRA